MFEIPAASEHLKAELKIYTLERIRRVFDVLHEKIETTLSVKDYVDLRLWIMRKQTELASLKSSVPPVDKDRNLNTAYAQVISSLGFLLMKMAHFEEGNPEYRNAIEEWVRSQPRGVFARFRAGISRIFGSNGT